MGKRTIDTLIQRCFLPQLLVFSSKEVDRIWTKSFGDGFVDVLNNFSLLVRRISVRDVEGQAYDIENFQVEFVRAERLQPMDANEQHERGVQEILSEELARSAPPIPDRRYASTRMRTRADLLPFIQECAGAGVRGADLSFVGDFRWYLAWRSSYLGLVGPSEHEFFHHPLAAIIVVSCTEEDPIARAKDLYSPLAPPPSLAAQSYIDPNVTCHYVVLCPSPAHQQRAEAVFKTMKKEFGSNACHALRVYCKENGSAGSMERDDRARLKNFVTDIVLQRLLPQLESTMRPIYESVVQARKGFKSIRAWFRPFSQSAPPTSGNNLPRMGGGNSTNVQHGPGSTIACRKLADYMFMLKDYESALSHYKICQSEFKNEKQWLHLAGCCEMIGITQYLVDMSKCKDSETELDKAYYHYLRYPKSFRHATRSTFFLTAILNSRRDYVDSAAVYARTGERLTIRDPLASALFFEQSAFCYLKMRESKIRKWAYNINQAAERFDNAVQPRHALGCFLAVSDVYSDRNWEDISNRLDYCIARQYHRLGELEQACTYIRKVLISSNAHRTPATQATYYREFLHLFSMLQKKLPHALPSLPIPQIVQSKVYVYLNSSYPVNRKSRSQRVQSNEEDWAELEELVTADDPSRALPNILSAFERKYSRYYTSPCSPLGSPVAVVNEYIHVDVELHNPGRVPLQFEQVRLLCTFSETPPPSVDTKRVLSRIELDDVLRAEKEFDLRTEIATESEVFAKSKDLFFKPGEVTKARFSIAPLKQGYVRIRGIGFYLGNALWGRSDFELPPRRCNQTRKDCKGEFYEFDSTLTINVTSPMPYLQTSFDDFPEQLLMGEICKTKVRVTNKGKQDLVNLRLAVSHTSAFAFGKPTLPCGVGDFTGSSVCRAEAEDGNRGVGNVLSEEVVMEELFSGETKIISTAAVKPTFFSMDGNSLPMKNIGWLAFDAVVLKPDESVEIPVFVRLDKTGVTNVRFLWFYRSSVPNKELSYRVQRLAKEVIVMPSLRVNYLRAWSASSNRSFLLCLEVANVQGNTSFELVQATSLSTTWVVEPLNSTADTAEFGGVPSPFELAPRESTTLYFRLLYSPAKGKPDEGFQRLFQIPLASERLMDPHELPAMSFLQREKDVQAQEDLSKPQRTDVVDVLVKWQSVGSKRTGQMHVLNINVDTDEKQAHKRPRSFSEKNARRGGLAAVQGSLPHLSTSQFENSALRLCVLSVRSIACDFSSGSFCETEVEFHFENTSATDTLQFRLETMEPQEPHPNSHGHAESYLWCGLTCQAVEALGPGENKVLRSGVCFLRPGIHNICRYKVVLQGAGSAPRTLFAPVQHIIRVGER